MDSRIRRQAEILVEHSTEVEPDDDVLIQARQSAEDLTVALAEQIGAIGATPTVQLISKRAERAYLGASDPEDLERSEPELAQVEAADVIIIVKGSRNAAERADVPSPVMTAHREAQRPITKARMDKRWVGTQFPAPGEAQRAEMSSDAYADFVYDAVNKDWDAQREHQQQLVDILDPADEVRIVSGETTDVTMSVAGMIAVSDHGEMNLPGGEVYTAPVPDSVEGEVLFDIPVVRSDREIEDASLQFEDGKVVEHGAAKNEDILTELLETDAGARRLGELGIGMNRDIDQFTRNLIFDEKMGDTVHLAIGKAYDHTVPDDRDRNESAIHVDMIVDMSEDSFIEVDGKVVQRDGTFRFEDGFEK
jgi:aminopeptidase